MKLLVTRLLHSTLVGRKNIGCIESFFNQIFDTCKDTSNIFYLQYVGHKASRIWKQGFQKLNWNNFLAVKVNGIRTKESNIFKTFHASSKIDQKS